MESICGRIIAVAAEVLLAGPDEQANTKELYITLAVKEYISSNYQNSSLSLTQIADAFKTSPRWISKVFKASVGISIPDYINLTRLNKATELLIKRFI